MRHQPGGRRRWSASAWRAGPPTGAAAGRSPATCRGTRPAPGPAGHRWVVTTHARIYSLMVVAAQKQGPGYTTIGTFLHSISPRQAPAQAGPEGQCATKEVIPPNFLALRRCWSDTGRFRCAHLTVLEHGHGERGVGVVVGLLLLYLLDLLPQPLLQGRGSPGEGMTLM